MHTPKLDDTEIDRDATQTTGLPTLCDPALGDCNLSGGADKGALQGLPLDGVSAWGAISRGEPSKRHEVMHDLWFKNNPDPEKRATLKPHWAALHLDGMKLLIGSGATDWQLYNITADVSEKNNLMGDPSVASVHF